MVWEDWLASVAPILGTTTTQAGVILALLFTFVFVIMAGLASPKHAEVGFSITALIFTFFFTYVAWYPIWTGTAMSLVLAMLTAVTIKSAFQS